MVSIAAESVVFLTVVGAGPPELHTVTADTEKRNGNGAAQVQILILV